MPRKNYILFAFVLLCVAFIIHDTRMDSRRDAAYQERCNREGC